MEYIIELNHINKKYGENVIFNDLNFRIPKNTFSAIVGKSGDGKSTLLNILGLLDTSYTGDYFLYAENVSKICDNKRAKIRNEHIGFIYQNYNLLDDLNVIDNIYLPFCYSKIKTDKAKKTYIDSLMDMLNIYHMKKQKIKYLSGGEKQRVAIARALAMEPSLILADEPTGNLDTYNRDIIIEFMKELKLNSKSIIVVTHDTSLLKEFDEVIQLSELR